MSNEYVPEPISTCSVPFFRIARTPSAVDIGLPDSSTFLSLLVGDAEEAEITVESEDETESSGEISTEMPATPSGATSTNGKKKSRGSRRKKKR